MKFLILALCITAAVADYHPLTSSEVATIKSTWDAVKTHEVDILYAIFKEHPDIQAKFSQFAGKDLDSLKGSTDFAIHATRIVSFISNYVLLVGDEHNVPGIKTVVNKMGQNHKARGVTKDQFNEFKNTFMNYMKGHVDFNGDVEHAWTDAFDNLYFIIFSNLDGHPVA
uniref:Globin n=1 Tax=Polypedilum nubifer TaxID=54969 RepID=V5YM17_9DIPT|nr:globin [Polypedilum nubifer]